MSITLVVEGRGAPVKSGLAVVTIGRALDNDLVVQDPRISSHHARLVRRGEGYEFEDLGSRNGSLVEKDGQRLLANAPIAIHQGDRLLLGDLVSPVVIRVDEAPDGLGTDQGATVVARRALDQGDALSQMEATDLRQLFRLQEELSGLAEPERVVDCALAGLMARFAQADCAGVLVKDGPGFKPLACHTRTDEPPLSPSQTLLAQTLEQRAALSYLPGGPLSPESVVGLAGVALVPLFHAEETLGVLHLQSRSRPFSEGELAWLEVLATHLAASLVVARRIGALSRSEAELKQQNDTLKRAAKLPRPILGQSPVLAQTLEQLRRVAAGKTTVLLLGETGTGKELAARFVHAHSDRADRVFAPIHCAALPDELLSSELFGHKKGSFTGAVADRKGLFEAAEGGTVFLDEIGEVSPTVQVRLLRVLQEREVQPVGANKTVPVDVRIVAATNRDLAGEVAAGRFRADLYYRLAVFPVKLPALKERPGDVMVLAERFREAACARQNRWVPGFTPEARMVMERYPWPGNVRQLEHEIERAVILADDGGLVRPQDLSPEVTGAPQLPLGEGELPRGPLREVLAELEERVIRRCLADHGGNRTRAAEALGISRQALQVKLAKWRDEDGLS